MPRVSRRWPGMPLQVHHRERRHVAAQARGRLSYPTHDVHVGTKIDSVGTLPPQETTRPATGVPPPVPGPSGGRTEAQSLPSLPARLLQPLRGPAAVPQALATRTGTRAPISAAGPHGQSQRTVGGRGATGPMGRATRYGAVGNPGRRRRLPWGGVSPAERHVPSGGRPTNGRAGGASSTGAVRGNGVVGGRPTARPQCRGGQPQRRRAARSSAARATPAPGRLRARSDSAE